MLIAKLLIITGILIWYFMFTMSSYKIKMSRKLYNSITCGHSSCKEVSLVPHPIASLLNRMMHCTQPDNIFVIWQHIQVMSAISIPIYIYICVCVRVRVCVLNS